MAGRSVSEELFMGREQECVCGAGGAEGACGAAAAAEGARVRVWLGGAGGAGGALGGAGERVLVWAPRARCVRWLGARLRRQFALRGRFALATRGHLLPASEPLAVLERDDTVQVIPLEDDFNEVDISILSNQRSTTVDSTASMSHDETDNFLQFEHGNQTTLPKAIQLDNHKLQNNQSASICEPHDPDMEMVHGRKDNGENKELERLKRHALELLDKHYASSEGPAHKRARRRRRRRKLQSSACPGKSDSIDPIESDDEKECITGSDLHEINCAPMETNIVDNTETGTAGQAITVQSETELAINALNGAVTGQALDKKAILKKTEGPDEIVTEISRGMVQEMANEVGAVVVRNSSGSRAPRLVRPLVDTNSPKVIV